MRPDLMAQCRSRPYDALKTDERNERSQSPKLSQAVKQYLGIEQGVADVAARMTGGRCDRADNRNPDYRRPWRDLVLGHRQILSRWPARAAAQAVGGSGLLGFDRSTPASHSWLSVSALGECCLRIFVQGLPRVATFEAEL